MGEAARMVSSGLETDIPRRDVNHLTDLWKYYSCKPNYHESLANFL